jgi:HflK protein
LLTGDGQFVELAATAQYRLKGGDPDALRAYAFRVTDPDSALRPLAESAVRTIVGRARLETLLTLGRREAERDAARLIQTRADGYGLGLVVTGVEFQDVHPPLAVVDAYRDVSRAESDRQRRRNEGATYQAEAVASARGQAAATVNQAEADRSARVDRASGEADAFRYLSAARAPYPALTDHRLYWDSIAATLAGKAKVVLDPGRASPRHLIVPEFSGAVGAPPIDPAMFVGPPKP